MRQGERQRGKERGRNKMKTEMYTIIMNNIKLLCNKIYNDISVIIGFMIKKN